MLGTAPIPALIVVLSHIDPMRQTSVATSCFHKCHFNQLARLHHISMPIALSPLTSSTEKQKTSPRGVVGEGERSAGQW